MIRKILLGAFILLSFTSAVRAQQSILPLIIQFESSGIPTAVNNTPGSTASGLFGNINSTWADALRFCGSACGTTAQFPTAASAPASIQLAANSALINHNGLSDWTCGGCDPALVRALNAAGGPSAFQISGLSTDPATFAAADQNLSGFLAGLSGTGGTPLSSGGLGVSSGGLGASGLGAAGVSGQIGGPGGLTIVTDQPGTSPGPGGGILDTVANQFQTATQGWQAALFNIALDLFWILAVIDLFASLIMLVIGGGRPDWVDVAMVVLRWVFVVGLFSWLMINGSSFAGIIINSLRQAGGALGSMAITPSAVFQAGINIVTTVWNNYHGFWQTIEMIPVMIAMIPVVIAFSLASIFMLMILIESYFILGLAALLLAFGGMRWSRDIAVGLLRACVAVGFKLLTIEAISPLATNLITQIANSAAGLSFQGIFTVLATGIAFAALAKIIPDRIERIVLGSHYSYAHAQQPIREAAGLGAAVVGTAALAGGSVAFALQAIKLAIEQQTQNMQQGGQGSGGARSLQLASGTIGALASAAGSEISGRLGGLYRGGPGASAVRMAGQVAQSRRVAAAEQSRPQTPGKGGSS